MSLFDRLKTVARKDWDAYIQHDFVRLVGDGRLPEAAFRTHLTQEYLFLIQHARACALAAYKARSLDDLRPAKEGLAALDVEIELHLRLCAQWGLDVTTVRAAPEHPVTLAYTRYVLDLGMTGDALDVQVALLPCTLGRAEIGQRLARQGVKVLSRSHPYHAWISEYASDAYQQMASEAHARLDALEQRHASAQRFPELTRIFTTATRLGADFWQMGLDAAL